MSQGAPTAGRRGRGVVALGLGLAFGLAGVLGLDRAAQAQTTEPAATNEPAAPTEPAPTLEPARLYDASSLRIAPIVVQPAPAPARDSRSLVWIGGLLVLAAVFFWNRNRRMELDKLEAAELRPPRRARGGRSATSEAALEPEAGASEASAAPGASAAPDPARASPAVGEPEAAPAAPDAEETRR